MPEPPASELLPDMRRSYELAGGLDEADLASTWQKQFERWLADVVEARRPPEANAMVLATADAQGRPSARTVLLKGVDERGFVLYTNLDSRKGRDALSNPHAALVFDWIELGRQVVVTGAVERVADAEADAYFASRPRGSQLSAHASPQSRPLASRGELEEAAREVARRHPEGEPIPRPANWGGLRVLPETVEFWHGRADRLHDRLRFRRTEAGDWIVERLAP